MTTLPASGTGGTAANGGTFADGIGPLAATSPVPAERARRGEGQTAGDAQHSRRTRPLPDRPGRPDGVRPPEPAHPRARGRRSGGAEAGVERGAAGGQARARARTGGAATLPRAPRGRGRGDRAARAGAGGAAQGCGADARRAQGRSARGLPAGVLRRGLLRPRGLPGTDQHGRVRALRREARQARPPGGGAAADGLRGRARAGGAPGGAGHAPDAGRRHAAHAAGGRLPAVADTSAVTAARAPGRAGGAAGAVVGGRTPGVRLVPFRQALRERAHRGPRPVAGRGDAHGSAPQARHGGDRDDRRAGHRDAGGPTVHIVHWDLHRAPRAGDVADPAGRDAHRGRPGGRGELRDRLPGGVGGAARAEPRRHLLRHGGRSVRARRDGPGVPVRRGHRARH